MLCVPVLLIVTESPKFLLFKERYDEAFVCINKLIDNKKYLLDENKKAIIIAQYKTFSQENTNSNMYSELFKPEYLRISILLFIIWYIVSYTFYGLIYILPSILESMFVHKDEFNSLSKEQNDKVIAEVIFSCVFEIPNTIITGILPNMKCLGRKGTMILGFAIGIVLAIFCIHSFDMMPLYASLLKPVLNIPFAVAYIYTAEVYPTNMRSTGLGISNFFSRLGGFTTPFIHEAIFQIKNYYPFYSIAISSCVGLVLSTFLPYETLGRVSY